MDKLKLAMHNDSLSRFGEKLYKDILTIDHIDGKKTVIKVDDVKYYGYFLEKNKKIYFLQDNEQANVLDRLPILVKDMMEIDYNRKVFYFIKRADSVKIPCAKKMELRQLVDTIAPFNHTNPRHFLLYKIMTIAAYTSRINYRVISPRGFGKDSGLCAIRDLLGNISNIYGATFAKLEYSLKHKHIVFNEMGNLKSEDRHNMQQFLLAVGAFFNQYIKKSRATEDTKENYDISKLSLGVLYNPPKYYLEKGQEFFDTMFTEAVLNRFMPFYMEGLLNESFTSEYDVEEIVTEHMPLYKDLISTLLYLSTDNPKNKYEMPKIVAFDEKTRRYERSFYKIVDYISEYSNSEQEYTELVTELYSCYTRYDKILKQELAKYNLIK